MDLAARAAMTGICRKRARFGLEPGLVEREREAKGEGI
jgi:hypothetical protein